MGALTGARAVLLAGPVALAFFTGGYFDLPRVYAGLVAWALAATALIAVPDAFPRARTARLALAGLALLAAWTLASFTWAPIAGSAYHAGQRVLLYVGSLIAAAALLRERRTLRALEPAIVAGTLVVVGYGISERLLPGLLHFHHSASARGRLEQPLTYWNAMGAVAATGLVVCARVVGDSTRPSAVRTAAAAAAAPLGMGLYLTFSRGALFACGAGLVALIVAAPQREQLRGLLLALAAAILAIAAAAPFGGVTTLAGSRAARERDGAIVFALLALVALLAAFAQRALARRAAGGALRLPPRAPLIAVAIVVAGFALAVAVGAKERAQPAASQGATRLASVESNRYAYWRVAIHAFGDQPVRGVGAGGFAVYWLRLRPFADPAVDAHSLYIQTLAELGILGAALLAAFLVGVGGSARSAHRAAPALAAGPIAGFVVWVAHCALDWDWEMPAVTLFALLLAGALVALADAPRPSDAPDAPELAADDARLSPAV